jgi:hypothetical protein
MSTPAIHVFIAVAIEYCPPTAAAGVVGDGTRSSLVIPTTNPLHAAWAGIRMAVELFPGRRLMIWSNLTGLHVRPVHPRDNHHPYDDIRRECVPGLLATGSEIRHLYDAVGSRWLEMAKDSARLHLASPTRSTPAGVSP